MAILFYKVQISSSDIRPHMMIMHMITSIFLRGLCGYIWANILTLLPQRDTSVVVTDGQVVRAGVSRDMKCTVMIRRS